MGGSETKTNSISQWKTIKKDRKLPYSIVRDDNGREGEQYIVNLTSSRDPYQQLKIYNLRKTVKQPIVRCYAAEFTDSGQFFSPTFTFRVILQRITHRLSDTPQLAFIQCLYTMQQALKGYKYLIENVGVFEINTAMIGYTAEGEARVWCNENYSLNYPQLRKNYVIGVSAKNDAENVSGEELFIMKEIACAIEEKCQMGKFPEPFRSDIENKGFAEANELIRGAIARLQMPTRLDFFKNKIVVRPLSSV